MSDEAKPKKGFLRVMFELLIGTVVTVILTLVVFLWTSQHKLIYYPHRYLSDAPGVEWQELASTTSEGKQVSYYALAGNKPPLAETPPSELWIVFSGNASTAGEWRDFIGRYPVTTAGFLLVDYPGYGFSQGKPSPDSIRAAASSAYNALEQHLGAEVLAKIPKNLLGHSLGAATALDFFAVSGIQPRRVVLVSPFTTLMTMARRAVGWPLCLLLRHNWDNGNNLSLLISRDPQPLVDIFHGALDEVIPVELGRELAKVSPVVSYHEVNGELHNTIIFRAEKEIYAAMTR